MTEAETLANLDQKEKTFVKQLEEVRSFDFATLSPYNLDQIYQVIRQVKAMRAQQQ